jgi:hypothetical protein
MNNIERNTKIAKEIAELSHRCFNNGITVDGKLWNEENEKLRTNHNITLDEWYKCRYIAEIYIGRR